MNVLQKFGTALIATMIALPAMAQDASNAKAAELACHRIERLVSLRKISADYLNKFYAFRIESQASAPKFKFIGYQSPGADGKSNAIEILLDNKGKAISHTLAEGNSSGAPAWPAKDPVTLMENALHYLLDNPSKPEVAPFFYALTEGSMAQVESSGQKFAAFEFRSSATSKVLRIVLKLDGAMVSVKVE